MLFGLSTLGLKVAFIALGVTTTAFVISTIVVAVQKSDLQDELQLCYDELGLATTYQPPFTTTPGTTASSTSTSSTTTTATQPTTTSTTTTSTSTMTTTTTEPPEPEINYRLPGNVIPDLYDLHLMPDLEGGHFSGTQTITVNVVEATNKIILHSNGLAITLVEVMEGLPETRFKRMTRISNQFSLDPVREFLIISLSETLKAQEVYTVRIEFNGIMLGKIVGLYSSSYSKDDGSKNLIPKGYHLQPYGQHLASLNKARFYFHVWKIRS